MKYFIPVCMLLKTCPYVFVFYFQVYKSKEVYDSQLSLITKAHCALIWDHDRILLGTDEGLHILELLRDSEYETMCQVRW